MSLRFKRSYPLILLLVFVLGFVSLTIGDERIVAYTVQAGSAATATVTPATEGSDYDNVVSLFDETSVHSVRILISDEDYEQMIGTYQNTGEKDYFEADVIIDGVRINDVGLRLKGNASLRTALGGGGGGGGGGQPPAGGGQPPADGEMPQPPDGAGPAQNADAEGAAMEMPGGAMQSDGTSKLPFLIKFDAFVEGQSYQGYTQLSIRNYGVSSDEAMLQEPVTNTMVRLIGLPATHTAYAGVQINDEAETLYVLSEIVDETYLQNYFSDASGVLYKAEVGSTLSYEGEDPSSYSGSFSQETRQNDADLAPLIAFIRFLNQSDDATFESELPNYLDVDAFASYLAINNLLVNTDTIAGMNNNYYLYYNETTERFTLLMWDANESLGKLAGGSRSTSYDLYYANQQQSGRMMGGGQNVLVKRFLANATYKGLYEQKLRQIYQDVFVSGAITQQIERYSALIQQVNGERSLVDLEKYNQAVEKAKTFVQQRTEYVDSTTLMQ